jgi:hypothetical protein
LHDGWGGMLALVESLHVCMALAPNETPFGKRQTKKER